METGVTIYKPNSAVMLRREMLNNPAVMGVLGPLEKSVFLASTAKTIAEHEDRELAGEIAKALKFIAKDVGYRDSGEDERGYLVVRVCEILKRYYGNLTVKDFKMAFEMSITGELDEYLPKGRDGQADRGHYQNFNAEYVCKILNAYKYRRAVVLKKANDAIPAPEQARNVETEEMMRREIVSDLCAAYEGFCADGRFPNVSPVAEMLYYKYLSDAGLAPVFVVTDEERRAVLENTITFYTMKGMTGDVTRLKEAGTQSEELQHGAIVLARRKALKAAFARMKEDKINIREYIK